MNEGFWTYMGTYTGRSGPPPPSVRPRALPVQVRTAPARGKRQHTPGEARLILACLGLIAVFCVLSGHLHSSPPPAPSYGTGTSGPAQFYPHSPAIGAAVIGAEAKGVGHAARFAGRMAFRGGVLRGLGGYHSYTPGGFGFHGFSFGAF